MKRVLLGMSGGLDSTYAVTRLREMGYFVEGAVLKMHSYTEVEEARACAESLSVPFRVIDAEEVFRQTVITNFVDCYRRGKTPNPCVLCNEAVKLRLLYEEAMKSSFDYIATGHYARVCRENGRYAVVMGVDARKDQSYMLYRLPQHILAKLILPLGDLLKTDVKETAKEQGIAAADRPESQEICFVQGEDYAQYIDRMAGAMPKGNFIDETGKVLGEHKGIHHYTVGQRKGLGVSADARLFVQCFDLATNQIVLARSPRLSKEFYVASPIFSGLEEQEAANGIDLSVKIRYLAKPISVRLSRTENGKWLAVLGGEASTLTPGQSAVFYSGDRVMLGGEIEVFEDVKR